MPNKISNWFATRRKELYLLQLAKQSCMSSCNLGKIFLIKLLAVLLTSGTVNYPRDNHIRKNRWNQKLTMHVNSTICAIEHQEQDPLLPIEASFKPYYESKIYQCCYSQPKHIHIIAELNMILKKIRMEASCSKELDQKNHCFHTCNCSSRHELDPYFPIQEKSYLVVHRVTISAKNNLIDIKSHT